MSRCIRPGNGNPANLCFRQQLSFSRLANLSILFSPPSYYRDSLSPMLRQRRSCLLDQSRPPVIAFRSLTTQNHHDRQAEELQAPSSTLEEADSCNSPERVECDETSAPEYATADGDDWPSYISKLGSMDKWTSGMFSLAMKQELKMLVLEVKRYKATVSLVETFSQVVAEASQVQSQNTPNSTNNERESTGMPFETGLRRAQNTLSICQKLLAKRRDSMELLVLDISDPLRNSRAFLGRLEEILGFRIKTCKERYHLEIFRLARTGMGSSTALTAMGSQYLEEIVELRCHQASKLVFPYCLFPRILQIQAICS